MSTNDRKPTTTDVDHEAPFVPLLDGKREQRQEYRLTGRVRVEVEKLAADPEKALPAETLDGFTSDISASGLRVNTAQAVAQGALLPVSVELPGQRLYRVIAEVMWCRRAGTRFLIGFRICESDDESVASWKEAVAELLAGE